MYDLHYSYRLTGVIFPIAEAITANENNRLMSLARW